MVWNERCSNSKLERIRPRRRCKPCSSNNSRRRRLQTTQAAGAGASAVVDTRLLTKPLAFDGRETSWRSLKFQFVACCGAIDSRLKDLLVLGETRDVAAMRNIHMDPDMRALSAC